MAQNNANPKKLGELGGKIMKIVWLLESFNMVVVVIVVGCYTKVN